MSHAYSLFFPLGAVAALASCGQPDQSDEARVVHATVRALVDSGIPKICVDNRTRGEPLAIFRTMAVAPDPARRPLVWRIPTRVGHGERLTGRDIINSQFSGLHPVLDEPDQEGQLLAPIEQFTLNTLARRLARDRSTQSVRLAKLDPRIAVRVRWWPINRFDPSCKRLVTVSNPVVARDTAFVSVTSGHWGTTYAFKRRGNAWRPSAQWADWLY